MHVWSRIASAAPLTEHSHDPERGSASDGSYPEVAMALRGIGSVVKFQRGAAIFREQDNANAIYRVISGGVALSRITDRRRRIIDFRFAGEFFGVVRRPEYTMGADASSDCVLLSYPRGYVDAMFDELPQFRRTLIGLLAEPVPSNSDTAESYTARERVEAFLSSLSGRIANSGEVNPPISCNDIADLLDVSPAAVECALRAWGSPGVRPEISAATSCCAANSVASA